MSEENEDTTGYVLASDYAEEELVGVEDVLTQLRNGTLDGRIINGRWYAKVGAKKGILMSEENEDTTGKDGYFAMPRTAQTKTKVTKVEVTRISIPFGDVLALTFKALFASLIVFAIPIAFIFMIAIINS